MEDGLTIAAFPNFFRAVTGFDSERGFDENKGFEPFPWQTRLARTVVEDEWPDVLDLPTASGKTATLEIAVFHLALEAHLPPEARAAPRRIFFVVDRRVVVDQAYERAARIADALADPDAPPVVRTVADRLKELAGPGAPPLAHQRLRGGIPRSNAWSRSPSQPAIITSTVDQIGSRLLFRGYGTSSLAAPIEAGLAANDVLVLLDEAHCARPFMETMQAVARYREWKESPTPWPFRFVTLSATPDVEDEEGESPPTVFQLNDEDREHPELKRRLTASKPAALTVAAKAKAPRGGGRAELAKARAELASAVAERAQAFLAEGRARRIAVMVNRVDTAVKIHRRLAEVRAGGLQSESVDVAESGGSSKEALPPFELVLMTGRLRSLDREDLLERWRGRLQAGAARSEDDPPVVVVSTQSLEVGADFDFDALVTEAASLDALRQRFGRLDRLGRAEGSARAVVVIGKYQEKTSEEDPIYGDALATTWGWLKGLASEEQGPDSWGGLDSAAIEAVVDFGIDPLEKHLREEDPEGVRSESTHAPALLPAHLDRWVQTAPVPTPDPDPAVFLHGSEPARPEVNLLWRRDLDPEAGEPAITDALALCPPSAVEALPVSLWWARRWLTGRGGVPDTESDVEGTGGPGEGAESETQSSRRFFLWRGSEGSRLTSDTSEIRPGDFVVIVSRPDEPPDLGPFEDFMATNGEAPHIDLGDRAQLEARGRAVLRLHPRLIDLWPDDLVDRELREALKKWLGEQPEERDRGELSFLLQSIEDAWPKSPAHRRYRWLGETVGLLLSGGFTIEPHPAAREGSAVILRGRRRKTPDDPGTVLGIPAIGEDTLDEDDADRWSLAEDRVSLGEHLSGVEKTVASIARRSGVPDELIEDLALAASLHDVGKADERFQALLHGDGLRRRYPPDAVLAKSSEFPPTPAAYRRLAEVSGVPAGFRHELVSVRMIESDPELLDRAHDPDLVLHLVVSHHGRARPFAPVVVDDSPVRVRWSVNGRELEAPSATGLETVGSGVPERFWRLVRRYGWWGLAYLEAILRKADHLRSAWEDTRTSTSSLQRAVGP